MVRCLVAIAALGLTATSPARGDAVGDWELVETAPEGHPGSRTEHSAIRVPAKDQMIVFGGHGNHRLSAVTNYYNDVFALHLGTGDWIPLAASGTAPTARSSHSAIFDAANNRMLVYGGKSPDGAVTYSELWSLSLSDAPAWTLLSPSGASPGPRSNHTAILDPVRNRMILYGGATGDAGVYALALTGPLQWQHLAVAGTSPGPRNGHTALYDPLRDRMVVFGEPSSSTWVMSLAGTPTWTPLFPSGTVPAQYYNCAMVYDSYRDRAVIYGGGTTYPTSDTHVLSLSGTPTFTKLMPASPPEGRSAAVAVYDPYRDQMVIHGGQYDGGATQHYAYEDANALVWGENVSVPPIEPLPTRSTIRLVRPNPASGIQAFEIEIATELRSGSLEVFSVTGQRVWSLELQPFAPGRHVLEWNGRGERGRNVAAGVYLARLRAGGFTSSQRFVRIP